MSKRRGLWLALAAGALLLLVGRASAAAYAEYRWYDALGATDVWRLRFVSAFTLRLIAFAVGAGFAFANLWGVRHSVVSLVLPRQLANIEIGEEVPGRALMGIVAGISVLIGALFAIPASDWQGFVLAQGGVPFDEADPYFNADLGFFVYWLPFERSVYLWIVTMVTVVSVLVIALYALTPSLKWERGRIHVSAYVRRHVALLSGIALALLAWSFRLDAYSALANGSAQGGAFGAFDHQLGVPISLMLSYAAIGSSLVVAWAGWTGQSRIALVVMTVILLLTPTMRYALPLAVRWASAPVDPVVRERPYAADAAGYTRRAFGVDRIRALAPAEAWRSAQDVAAASVWDPVALTRAIERTRRRGPVVGAAGIASSPSGPVMLSVEQPARMDAPAQGDWMVVRSLAAITDERGALLRVDERGQFPLEDQVVGQVLVYEGARGDLVVTDSAPHPAAPLMETFGARLAEAWSRQNFRLLASPARGARMMTLRDVRERVRALAPFFALGATIAPLVHGDSLLWAVELYSVTAEYPLSRRMTFGDREVNYARHAATAFVHAYNGRVTILPDEDLDPIARTWTARLGVTFARPRSIAPSLMALRPPDADGAALQAEAFAAVGTRGEGAMRRSVPLFNGDTLVTSHAPTFIWSPALGTSVWMVPLIDSRDHVSGVLVANGGARRELRWFRYADTTMSWPGLLERLRRVADNGGRQTASLAAGRVRLLPLAGGQLVAFQPFYSWPSDGPPTMSRVAFVLNDSARSATSLAAAAGAPVVAGPAPSTPDARQERMRVLYAEMRAALARGDWRAFGAAFDALGALLERR